MNRLSEISEYKDYEIIIYDQSGYNSRIIAQNLANRDFSNVYNMIGGMDAWLEQDYEIFAG